MFQEGGHQSSTSSWCLHLFASLTKLNSNYLDDRLVVKCIFQQKLSKASQKWESAAFNCLKINWISFISGLFVRDEQRMKWKKGNVCIYHDKGGETGSFLLSTETSRQNQSTCGVPWCWFRSVCFCWLLHWVCLCVSASVFSSSSQNLSLAERSRGSSFTRLRPLYLQLCAVKKLLGSAGDGRREGKRVVYIPVEPVERRSVGWCGSETSGGSGWGRTGMEEWGRPYRLCCVRDVGVISRFSSADKSVSNKAAGRCWAQAELSSSETSFGSWKAKSNFTGPSLSCKEATNPALWQAGNGECFFTIFSWWLKRLIDDQTTSNLI